MNLDIVRAGDEVKTLLSSEPWKEFVEPLLDKMIGDVFGCKENGRWHNGSMARTDAKDHIELVYRQAYKTALVNFHDALYQMVDDSEREKKGSEDEEPEVTGTSMYETRYSE